MSAWHHRNTEIKFLQLIVGSGVRLKHDDIPLLFRWGQVWNVATLNQVFRENMIAGDRLVTQFLNEKDPLKYHIS